MSKILSGKIVRDEIAKRLKKEISKLRIKPTIAIIQIGNLPESNAYIGQKKLFAEKIGAKCIHLRFPNSIKEEKLILQIKILNTDRKIHGIIVQMPIPKSLNKTAIIEAINPVKDVDGLHSVNIKKLWLAEAAHVPATAKGILTLLEHYKIPVKGKSVVVVGRSILVGRPVAILMLNNDATITVAHSKTTDLAKVTKEGDILIVAAGVARLIGARHVKAGQVVIDVGINTSARPPALLAKAWQAGRLQNKKLEDEISPPKLIGDVDFKAVSKIVKAISPVPGGVGPMTVASLFENLMEAYHRQIDHSKIKQ